VVGPFRGKICDDLDAELRCGLHESDGPALDVQGEWRVLNFGGRDGVCDVCPTKGKGRDLGGSEVFV
jgi:hypothetical protein